MKDEKVVKTEKKVDRFVERRVGIKKEEELREMGSGRVKERREDNGRRWVVKREKRVEGERVKR